MKIKLFLSIVLIIGFFSCGVSKEKGSEFIGKWDGARGDGCKCLLDISKNGESFIVKNVNNCRDCGTYEGILTLTPEGNLSGTMGLVTLSFDKTSKQIILSVGGNLQYLQPQQ